MVLPLTGRGHEGSEGLSSKNVYGGCVLFKSLSDDRASRDTNLQFSFVMPQVSIFCYLGILNDGFDHPPRKVLRL